MKYIKIWKYNIRHKWYVMLECFKRGLYLQGILHDWDKFLVPRLWKSYANYFYGDKENPNTRRMFEYVWLEHKNRNKHHWQYWINVNDDGSEVVFDMPHKHRLEMVCDWMGAGKAQGFFSPKDKSNLEVTNWYIKNRENMRLSGNTREWVESYLGLAGLPNLEENPSA